MKAVVVGGGLAGITAAIALAQAGHEVTLLEAKPRLGGATMSFSRDGLVIDTGQHVFLRCCTAYRGLLDRLGMAAHAPLQPRFDVTVVSPARRARLKRGRVPAPLHMLPALLGYPFLNFAERSRLSRAALAFKRLNEADPKTDELRLGDWLAAHGQDDRTRRVLWDLFSISSLNVPGDDASLALAATVVKTGLLGDAGAADIGVPALSLGELHGGAAERLLSKLGATVRLGTKVAAIEAVSSGGADFPHEGPRPPSRMGGSRPPSPPAIPPGPRTPRSMSDRKAKISDMLKGDNEFLIRLARRTQAGGAQAGGAQAGGAQAGGAQAGGAQAGGAQTGGTQAGGAQTGGTPDGQDGSPANDSTVDDSTVDDSAANDGAGNDGYADGGELILADAVVLAVPHEQAAKLIPDGALPAETVDGWAGLGAAPIVNLHVFYDRKVMDVPLAAAVDSPVQWVFDRTRISGMHARGDDGQYLAISLSAADEYVNMTVAELREMFVPALAKLFPEAREATVTEFFVTRERRATFRQVPGTARLRPSAATALPGLVLAGSWTDTGWPDTMEGAVRSGLSAVISLHDRLASTPSAAPQPAPRAERAFGHTLAGPKAQSAQSVVGPNAQSARWGAAGMGKLRLK